MFEKVIFIGQKGFVANHLRGGCSMVVLKERIVEKLGFLPESNLREVLNFVEFLTWRIPGEDEPLLSVAGILSGEMLSAKDIEQELYGDEAGV
jgi:hypothetical protein